MHELPQDLYQIPLEQKLDLIENFLIAVSTANLPELTNVFSVNI